MSPATAGPMARAMLTLIDDSDAASLIIAAGTMSGISEAKAGSWMAEHTPSTKVVASRMPGVVLPVQVRYVRTHTATSCTVWE